MLGECLSKVSLLWVNWEKGPGEFSTSGDRGEKGRRGDVSERLQMIVYTVSLEGRFQEASYNVWFQSQKFLGRKFGFETCDWLSPILSWKPKSLSGKSVMDLTPPWDVGPENLEFEGSCYIYDKDK